MTHRSHRRNQRSSIGRALVAIAIAAFVTPATADNATNVVRAIEVEQGDGNAYVRIVGTKETTFTVFRLAEPPRVVVDLSSTDISGVERLLEVNRGNVRAVLTTQFSDAGAQVGRVTVALENEVEYDVANVGNEVVVTVPDGSDAAAAVASADDTEADDAAEAEAEVAETAAPPLVEAPAVVAEAADPSSEVQVAEVVAIPEDAEPTNERPVDLPPGVVGRQLIEVPEAEANGSRVLSVKTRVTARHTTVNVKTDGAPRSIETLELVDPPRLAIDLHGLSKAPRKARTAALIRSTVIKDVRVGRHDHMVRIVVDAVGDEMPPYKVHRNSSGLAIRLNVPAKTPTNVAHVAPVRSATPAERTIANLSTLTYTREGRTGRVRLSLDDAESARWVVAQPDPRTAVLTIDGATLDPAIEQTFDTSGEGGEVMALTAYRAPGRDSQLKIVASVTRKLPNKVVRTSDGLTWEFQLGDVSEAQPVASRDEAPEQMTTRTAAAGLSSEAASHVSTSREQQRKRYRGKRINLEFKEIDIHNVLRLIAEVSKRNIVVADDVKGKVTLRLKNVPWDQALDLVLRSKELDKEIMGNIIRVAPAEQIAKERKARLDAAKEKQELAPLKVALIPVNFATAKEMKDKVKDVLSERGSVTVDSRTNMLIVKDVVENLTRASKLVETLDSETPQVLIESRIVEANANYTREVGIQWGGNVVMSPAFGNPTGLVFPNIVSLAGAGTDGQTPTTGTADAPNFAVNLPAPIGTNAGGGLGFIFGSAGGAANLNLRLSALENEGVIKTISAPKVTTLDNAEATISQGLSIPFSQVSAAGVNTTFIQAKLELSVTPHVTSDGSILMDINVTNNQPNPQLTGANGQPSISQKEAKTNVMVKDSETTVIGGIYTRQNSETVSGVPGLSKIPILGWLFKKKSVSDSRTELLVFITPKIINRSRTAARVGAGGSL